MKGWMVNRRRYTSIGCIDGLCNEKYKIHGSAWSKLLFEPKRDFNFMQTLALLLQFWKNPTYHIYYQLFSSTSRISIISSESNDKADITETKD